MISLHPSLLNHLSHGYALTLDENSKVWRPLNWKEWIVRQFDSRMTLENDQALSDCLIQHLQTNAIDKKEQTALLEALTRYVRLAKRCDASFQRLKNTVFAIKCERQIPSFSKESLIESNGQEKTHGLLSFIEKHHLQRVIPKANPKQKNSAILIDSSGVYIRAKEGVSFLDDADKIALLLDVLPKEEGDRPLLEELRGLILNSESPPQRAEEIRAQLKFSHYCYRPLQEIKEDTAAWAYLADGIETFHETQWEELKPSFKELAIREGANESKYKLRIVTRLPIYSRENNTLRAMIKMIQNIFDFRLHGHSWVELVEDVSDEPTQGSLQNVYCVGYYFHPSDAKKRFRSPDPEAYKDIPPDLKKIDEIALTQEQFKKAKLYIQEVQTLMKNPQHKWSDAPNNPALDQSQKEAIQYIYKATLKSTCLSFANALLEKVDQLPLDDRCFIRRWLLPKSMYPYVDCLDDVIERSFILKQLVRIPSFILRMELPCSNR